MRLGRRQLDVLAAAKVDKAHAWHARRGNFYVAGLDEVYDGAVLDRLLELGLVRHGRETISGYHLELTPAGEQALRHARGEST